jgi:hypothetical protein
LSLEDLSLLYTYCAVDQHEDNHPICCSFCFG